MYCTNCGKEIDDNLRFCNHCGSPVAASQSESKPEPEPAPSPAQSNVNVAANKQETSTKTVTTKTKKSKAPIIIVVIIVVVFVFWLIGFVANQKVHHGLTKPSQSATIVEDTEPIEIEKTVDEVEEAEADTTTTAKSSSSGTVAEETIYNVMGSTYGGILEGKQLTYGPIILTLNDGFYGQDEDAIAAENIMDPAFIYIDTNIWEDFDFDTVDGDWLLAAFEESVGQSAELVSFDKGTVDDAYPAILYSTKFVSEGTDYDTYVAELLVFEDFDSNMAARVYGMSASETRNSEIMEMLRNASANFVETTEADTGMGTGNEMKFCIK